MSTTRGMFPEYSQLFKNSTQKLITWNPGEVDTLERLILFEGFAGFFSNFFSVRLGWYVMVGVMFSWVFGDRLCGLETNENSWQT